MKPPKTVDPKKHPFTPVTEGSTKCKWCMFAQSAHRKKSTKPRSK